MGNLSVEGLNKIGFGGSYKNLVDADENVQMKAVPTVSAADRLEPGKDFVNMLKDSIGKVNEMQNEAEVSMQELAAGKRKNIHETIIAMEKAEVSFKLMTQVRNKVIDAYREIMRMGV